MYPQDIAAPPLSAPTHPTIHKGTVNDYLASLFSAQWLYNIITQSRAFYHTTYIFQYLILTILLPVFHHIFSYRYVERYNL